MVCVLTAAEQDRRHRLLLGSVDYVLAAVIINGHDLQYASAEMKNKENVVLAAVQQDGVALHHASEEMKNNENVVLAAVQQNGVALQYASEEMKNTNAAVQQNGLHSSTPLRRRQQKAKPCCFGTSLFWLRVGLSSSFSAA